MTAFGNFKVWVSLVCVFCCINFFRERDGRLERFRKCHCQPHAQYTLWGLLSPTLPLGHPHLSPTHTLSPKRRVRLSLRRASFGAWMNVGDGCAEGEQCCVLSIGVTPQGVPWEAAFHVKANKKKNPTSPSPRDPVFWYSKKTSHSFAFPKGGYWGIWGMTSYSGKDGSEARPAA